jgi:hypothetical protein
MVQEVKGKESAIRNYIKSNSLGCPSKNFKDGQRNCCHLKRSIFEKDLIEELDKGTNIIN